MGAKATSDLIAVEVGGAASHVGEARRRAAAGPLCTVHVDGSDPRVPLVAGVLDVAIDEPLAVFWARPGGETVPHHAKGHDPRHAQHQRQAGESFAPLGPSPPLGIETARKRHADARVWEGLTS